MNRSARILLRLTPAEKEIIEDRAKTVGLTVSMYLRELGTTGSLERLVNLNIEMGRSMTRKESCPSQKSSS